MAKFKSASGGHVAVYVDWRPDPIHIGEGETVEHDDKRILAALRSSPEVVEVKGKKAEK